MTLGRSIATHPSSWLVLAQLGLGEPQSNLLGGSFERVRSVNQVPPGVVSLSTDSVMTAIWIVEITHPTETANCPRTDPGSDSRGLVAPTIRRYCQYPVSPLLRWPDQSM